jgi:hypothetical protein
MFQEEQLGFSKCHRILDTRLINFSQQSAMQLNDPSLKRYPSFRFPGGLPITPEQCHVNKIRNGNYMFTAKADGFRVLLLFVMYYIDGDWRRLCVMISRDGSCHLLTVNVPSDLNDNGGTLFDGELVSTSSGWNHILLFDCYCYRGSNLRALPLNRRHARCETLAEECDHNESASLMIKCKPYYKLETSNLETAISFLQNKHFLEYPTDGIILVPNGRNSCINGRDEAQFKLKTDHTVDLILMQDTDDEEMPFYLSSYDDTDDSYIVKQQVQPDEIEGFDVNTVFECHVKTIDNIHTFTPLKPRPDKTHPNSETVVKRTLRTISDNIQIQTLMIT